MRRGAAVVITVAISLGCCAAVPVVTDVPLMKTGVPQGRELRAAVAIRDDETPFQKWGSREFTLPYLERYYGRAAYFTLSGDQSQVRDFTAAVGEALAEADVVDLYLLAHSNELVRWVETLPERGRRKLRVVYNTGCTDVRQGPEWLALGAKAYVGHPGESLSPVFYVYFLRRWARGTTLDAAVGEGNRRAFRVFDALGPASLGNLDPEQLKADSEATIFGDPSLRIDGTP
jgi:hypothetical protein